MARRIQIPHNYTPRDYQLPFLEAMDGGCKRAVLVWHRRAGKDKTVLNWVIKQMLARVGAYYYFFPTYAQGKKILWDGIDADGFKFINHFPPEIIKKKNETDLKVELVNGSFLQIIGSDKIDSVVGTNPVGCVYSEWSLQNPAAYDLFRPILRENGGWAVFPYTPRGDNHGQSLFEMAATNPEWFCQLLTVDDTRRPDGSPVITKEDIAKDIAEGMDADLVPQEYYCSFKAGVKGSYYAEQMLAAENEGRICTIPYEPTVPVITSWDLGMNDENPIWFFQVVGKEIRAIDYFAMNNKGLDYYAKVLKEKPYVYDCHYLPHDVEVRSLSTGTSRKDTLEGLGIRPILTVEAVKKQADGIQAVRQMLPRIWFDKVKCVDGIKALKNYHREWDDKKKVFVEYPAHDWASHPSKAFETFARGYEEKVKSTAPPIRVSYAHGPMAGLA